MSTTAIGDIHGNMRALDDLLARLAPELGGDDTVVFLGDYIDRGPDSKRCIERILDFRRTCKARVVALLGNHEQWLLQTCHDHTRHSWILGLEAFPTIRSYSPNAAAQLVEAIGNLGARVVLDHVRLPYDLFFDAVPPEHMAFLSSLATFLRTPEAVCVHGGLDPAGGSVEEQEADRLIWGADGFPEGYQGRDRIVYGHADNPVLDALGWPHPRITGRTYGLDTIGQGVLTAVRLPGEAVFQSARYLDERVVRGSS